MKITKKLIAVLILQEYYLVVLPPKAHLNDLKVSGLEKTLIDSY